MRIAPRAAIAAPRAENRACTDSCLPASFFKAIPTYTSPEEFTSSEDSQSLLKFSEAEDFQKF
ncbi:hypothetical protein A2U01_0069537 [Trifolium medium]|uniref:Uncharacterized protein n=1 Tax=Trifolium medium TaxID=97028 RepID=A0A392SJB1_9FABA|nr:hypothetical protein [Trifolium medium]